MEGDRAFLKVIRRERFQYHALPVGNICFNGLSVQLPTDKINVDSGSPEVVYVENDSLAHDRLAVRRLRLRLVVIAQPQIAQLSFKSNSFRHISCNSVKTCEM